MTYSYKLIKIYCRFIEKDMMYSMFLVRDWDFIEHHMQAIDLYIDYKIESSDDIKKKLDTKISFLENKATTVYETGKTNQKFIKCESFINESMELEHFSEENSSTVKDIVNNLVLFIRAYQEAQYRTLCRLIPNSLNEYHNVFSHLLPLFYDNDTADISNLRKANSHLVRGILDSCKIIIEHEEARIADDEELLSEYCNLRELELNKVGLIDESSPKKENSITIKYMRYISKILFPQGSL